MKPQMLFGRTVEGQPFAVSPFRPVIARYEVEVPDGIEIFTLEQMTHLCRCKPESLARIWRRQFANLIDHAAQIVAQGKEVNP